MMRAPKQHGFSWSRGRALVAGIAFAITVVLVVLMVRDIGAGRSSPATRARAAAATEAVTSGSDDATLPSASSSDPHPASGAGPAGTPVTVPPWEATPANSPETPEGHVPAWEVEQVAPEPIEPPDPAQLLEPSDPAALARPTATPD